MITPHCVREAMASGASCFITRFFARVPKDLNCRLLPVRMWRSSLEGLSARQRSSKVRQCADISDATQ